MEKKNTFWTEMARPVVVLVVICLVASALLGFTNAKTAPVIEENIRIEAEKTRKEVIQKLGEGGQGVVYKVNYNGKPLALKWYFGNKLNNADKFYRNIQNNIKQGTPTGAFLWPLEITEYFEGSFGYLMELRPPEYKDFSLFLLAKVHFANIEALINTALCITNGFRELHNRGYSYQDLNLSLIHI